MARSRSRNSKPIAKPEFLPDSTRLLMNDSQPLKPRLLDSVRAPADVRALPPALLPQLASEIREELIKVTSTNGGHIGPNLGVVELTIAAPDL